jgi:hypothetical protein
MNKDLFRIYDLYNDILSQKNIIESISATNIRFNRGVNDSKLNKDLTTKLNNIAKEYGKTFTITSAFRDSQKNKGVGGVENSEHTKGNAVDLVLPSMSDQNDIKRFVEISSNNGIGGIGVYKTHIHLDVGSKRYWGDDKTKNSAPNWLLATLENHVKGVTSQTSPTDVATTTQFKPEFENKGLGGLLNLGLNTGATYSDFISYMTNNPLTQKITSSRFHTSPIISENVKYDEIVGKKTKIINGNIIIPYSDNNKIKSSVKGKFVKLGVNQLCKNEITIEFKLSNDTYYLEYCGISFPSVNVGDEIKKNDILGTTSNNVEVTLRNTYNQKIPFESKVNDGNTNKLDVNHSLFSLIIGAIAKPFEKGWESPTSGKKPNIFPKKPKKEQIEEDVLRKIGINNFRDLFNKMPQELQKRVYELKKIPQNKKWHPEGNVLKHTITVVNRALKSDDIDMAIAAIMHDIGKDETLKFNEKTNEPTAYGHENVSADLVDEYKDWIESIGGDPEIVHYIVKNHMSIKYFDVMNQSKIDKIKSNPNYDKLSKFGEYDKGGLKIENNKKLQENIQRIKQILK